ncbi:MAG: hypothetical protein KIPDCIKN_02860 [Haliscomenobacter sp.]|jgi:hypothetical protein|nr:hypothetical protein [Haliscomenobacter sp.]
MIRRNSVFSVCALILLLASCQKEAPSGLNTVSIAPEQSARLAFSDVFESVEYIPLRGDLLGQVQKILFRPDTILIASNSPGCVTGFDAKGNQVFSFCRQGEAPGQYKSISDFNFNPSGNRIEALDLKTLSMRYYDLSGNFISGYKHFLFSLSFHRLDAERIAFYCGNQTSDYNNTKLVVFNEKNQKVERGFIPIPKALGKRYANFFEPNNFLRLQDSLLFFHYFNDTIYHLTPERLTPRTLIRFGKYTLPQSILDKEYDNVAVFMEQIRKTEYAFHKIGYQESKDAIAFTFEHRGLFHLAYYDKRSGNQKVAHQLKDDMVVKGFSIEAIEYVPLTTTEDGRIVFLVESPVLKDAIEKEKAATTRQEWAKRLASNTQLRNLDAYLAQYDNPILLVGKFKPL